MLVWYNLYIIIISWNVTCCPHDINGPFCLILGKTTIPHSYVINIKWKITNTTLSAQYQNIRIFFNGWFICLKCGLPWYQSYIYVPHCLYQKEGNCVIHTICVWPSFYVSERGKLYHTCNMFMFWSLCSRKREAVSYIQHVYHLDFMNRKGGNCIIPTICLCSRFCVSERRKLYYTHNMFMF